MIKHFHEYNNFIKDLEQQASLIALAVDQGIAKMLIFKQQ